MSAAAAQFVWLATFGAPMLALGVLAQCWSVKNKPWTYVFVAAVLSGAVAGVTVCASLTGDLSKLDGFEPIGVMIQAFAVGLAIGGVVGYAIASVALGTPGRIAGTIVSLAVALFVGIAVAGSLQATEEAPFFAAGMGIGTAALVLAVLVMVATTLGVRRGTSF